MAFSIWLIWKTPTSKSKTTAYLFFAAQTLLNAIWPSLFFGLRSPLLAFIDILFLTCFIIGTILAFYKINRVAAYLLIPYFFWVIYATALNGTIFYLNRSI
jgi:tryptophan-rich sensory protein